MLADMKMKILAIAFLVISVVIGVAMIPQLNRYGTESLMISPFRVF